MNDYFDYLDMNTEYTKAYPNDSMYKNTIIQKNTFPSKIPNMMNVQNQNPINNIMNFDDGNCGLYNSTEGTLKGNMFPNLYDPYKNEGQKRFVPSNERERQLFEIQKSAFAMKDINLYLDTHPNDTCMINLFNRYLEENKRQLKNYEEQYGPITLKSEGGN